MVAQERAHCFPQAAAWAPPPPPPPPSTSAASNAAASHRGCPHVGACLQAAEAERRRQHEAQREREVKRAQEEQERRRQEAEEASLHCLGCLHQLLIQAAVSSRHCRQPVACKLCLPVWHLLLL